MLKQKELYVASTTYLPAVFANAQVVAGFNHTMLKVMPVIQNVLIRAQELRYRGVLDKQTPLSFRSLAEPASINRMLQLETHIPIMINIKNGVAILQ
ncbi:hypothetical protein CI610_02019 [invertebrate metagenome]|uniref:Uncharacterized protein n=1 Tax=invertebrate metagenome TaxID=1711999 RepID=A0A2H9T735_9ZZZZ